MNGSDQFFLQPVQYAEKPVLKYCGMQFTT